MKSSLKIVGLVLLSCAVYAQAEPYALGADISYVPQMVDCGISFRRSGSTQSVNILDILQENGFNYIRLRLFVDPTAEVTEDLTASHRESPYNIRNGANCYNNGNGNTGRYEAFCGLDSTINFAK